MSDDYLDYLACRAAGDTLGGLGEGDPAVLARHAARKEAIAAAPDRATAIVRRAQAYLDLWAESDVAESPLHWPVERDDREYGQALGEGWSAAGGEGPPAEAEGLIDGHVFYYRAEDGDWSVGIAEAGAPSAVTVGWHASGSTGWLVEGKDADDPGLPLSERRAGIWPRLDLAAAAFRAGTARRVEFAEGHEPDLERRLLLSMFALPVAGAWDPERVAAWFATPHPYLGGRTPEAALAAGEYLRLDALILAEREVPSDEASGGDRGWETSDRSTPAALDDCGS
jgi:hypothetical protein